MLTIDPVGGLCNRLRALDSTLALANQINRPVHLLWRKNRELNCNFSSLFHVPEGVTKLSEPYTPIFVKKLIKKSKFYAYKYHKVLFQKDIGLLLDNNFDFESLRKYDSIYISSLSRFYENKEPFSYIKPLAAIRRKVNQVTVKFSASTIGVHIRRGDNTKSSNESTLDNFIQQMNHEKSKNSHTNFFLATDDPATEKYLIELFGNKIIFYPKKEIKRNVPIAIEDALVDLLCLSKTRKILGSYWSSFSDTASQMNNVEILIVR